MELSKPKEYTYKARHRPKNASLKPVYDESSFVSQRTLAQYIGICARPDICAQVQLMAPISSAIRPRNMDNFNSLVCHLNKASWTGQSVLPLDLGSSKVVLFSDAEFDSTANLKNQLGLVLAVIDGNGKGHTIHYAASRCSRVARSVMEAEVQALVQLLDQVFIIPQLITDICGVRVDLLPWTDANTLFDVVAKYTVTAEKRFQIDIFALRESYSCSDLGEISWIPGCENPADDLTDVVN